MRIEDPHFELVVNPWVSELLGYLARGNHLLQGVGTPTSGGRRPVQTVRLANVVDTGVIAVTVGAVGGGGCSVSKT